VDAAVLLHGQPGAAQDWDLVVEALAGRVRTLVPDRPGYGASHAPATGFDGNVLAVRDLLDAAGIEQAVVVGYSWSGAVALACALQFPSRVSGLVLAGSIGGTDAVDVVDRVLSLPVIGPLMTLAGLSVLRLPVARRAIAPVAADRLSHPSWGSWRSFVTEQQALTTELVPITSRLGSITAPSVVVIGDADRVVRPADQQRLADGLANSSVMRVAGCGHLLPWEAPGVIADAILSLHSIPLA
jgi:pimeloyl-ACP methyl ester carboxylesterase